MSSAEGAYAAELVKQFRTYRDFCLAAGDARGEVKAAVWDEAAKIVEQSAPTPCPTQDCPYWSWACPTHQKTDPEASS